MATIGQITLLGLFNEMDVKGTCSGKLKIFAENGVPVDVLGYMLQRLGYQVVEGTTRWESTSACISPDGRKDSSYTHAQEELAVTRNGLQTIWREIDRHESTNDSIRNTVIRVCNLQNDPCLQN